MYEAGHFTDAKDVIIEKDGISYTAHHITLTAAYTPKEYVISFVPGDDCTTIDFATKEVTFNDTFGELATPEYPAGYEFLGWTLEGSDDMISPDDIVKITEDTKLYAKYEAKDFTVYYSLDGGTCDNNQKAVIFNEAYGELPTPVKPGYHFVGWFKTLTGSEEVTADTIVTKGRNHYIYARWELADFTVRLEPNEGSCDIKNIQTTYTKKYGLNTELPTPTKTGYHFKGWYTSIPNGSRVTSTVTYTSTENTTLYAYWVPETYAVSFVSEGNCEFGLAYISYHDAYNLPKTEREGYTFTGWQTEDGTIIEENDLCVIASDHTLTATWEKLPDAEFYENPLSALGNDEYAQLVTINTETNYTNDGTLVEKINNCYNLPVKTKDGYQFIGWYLDADCQYSVNGDSALTISENVITLYIKWKKLNENETTEEDLSYKENLNTLISLGGNSYYEKYNLDTDTLTLNTGEIATKTENNDLILPSLTKDGYTFDGWYVDALCRTKIADATNVETHGNILVIFAKWTKKEIEHEDNPVLPTAGAFDQVTNHVYAETVAIDTITGIMHDGNKLEIINGQYILPEIRQKDGYTFAGWYKDKELNHSITDETVEIQIVENTMYVYAKWEVKNEDEENGGNTNPGEDDKPSVELPEKDTTSESKQLDETTSSQRFVLDIESGSLGNGMMAERDENGAFILPTLTKKEHIFGGWYLDADCTDNANECEMSVNDGKAILYVKWIHVNQAPETTTEEETDGTEATIIEVPTTTTTEEPATENTDTSSDADKEDISKTTYEITFCKNFGNDEEAVMDTEKDGTLQSTPIFTRKGYKFTGWYTKRKGGTKVDSDTVFKENDILYAHWKKVSVKRASISSIKKKSKSIVISTKKLNADGYDICYSNTKTFKKSTHIFSKSTKRTVYLKKGKTYYIKVRAYKLDSAGNKIYGSWSVVKRVKMKK